MLSPEKAETRREIRSSLIRCADRTMPECPGSPPSRTGVRESRLHQFTEDDGHATAVPASATARPPERPRTRKRLPDSPHCPPGRLFNTASVALLESRA